jgi:ribonuclease P/MRP protein subunit POP5
MKTVVVIDIKKIKILPTLREKTRYLAFEVISDHEIKDFKAISEEIEDKSLLFLGQLGLAKAGIRILPEKWNLQFQKGLIKINNKYVNELKSSLTLIEKINNKKVVVKSIGVSGILKKAEQRYLR